MNEFRTPENLHPGDIVSIGSLVTVRLRVLSEVPAEEVATIQVTGPGDSGITGEADWNVRTDESLGEELLGKAVGNVVLFKNRRGDWSHAEILEVKQTS